MRIAQVSPLYESVPPRAYGGTERVVSYLTEALVELGHDVTLFAAGDSITRARLAPQSPRSLRLDGDCIDHAAHHVVMIERIFKEADAYDIIHSHIDYLPFPLARRCPTPFITTLHGRLDIRDLIPLYREFSDMAVISISNAQRGPLPWIRWIGTVYHGLPEDLYSVEENPDHYLAFLGRISPEKRVDIAIEIAKRAEIPLKIAAKIDKVDADYFQYVIRPLMDHPLIEYVGEIGDREKNEFIGKALALLAPIDWPEPFGLVFIEAMACGTPVITCPKGSAPELIEPGITGYIVDSIDDAVTAVREISAIDRRRCREVFEQQFTSMRMAEDYVRHYFEMVQAPLLLEAELRLSMGAKATNRAQISIR
jgi:glycosyltransferase involved in cell wall biosynthesis